MKKAAWRAVIEIAFIMFLFYSNLLMGEFERSPHPILTAGALDSLVKRGGLCSRSSFQKAYV